MVVPGKSEKVKPSVYHEQEIARGWRILHQFLKIDVNLDTHTIRGVAEFSLRALNQQCCTVKINVRRCSVLSCSVNGMPTSFKLESPLDFEPLLDAVSSESPPHRMEDIKLECDIQKNCSSEGELKIDLPPSVSADIIDDFKALSPEQNGTESAPVPSPVPPATALLHELPPLTVRVEYEVSNRTGGVMFYGSPESENPLHDPMYMLTESRYGLARCWMPCVDSLNWCDRYVFDLDITVRSHLVVVASGDLAETRVIPPDEEVSYERKLHSYRSGVPAHAKEIVVAVGPFMPFPDPALPMSVTHFCLPGQADKLVQTSPPLFASALAFCRDYFGFDPPCTSFKQLFLGPLGEERNTNYCAAGGLAVLSGSLLCTPRCIDAGFQAREAIMSTLVQSYIGCLLRPRGVDDAWIIAGLAAHVTALGLQSLFGRNWFRFRMLDEMNALCQESPADAVVLSQIDPGVHIDVTAQAARRRAHIIVYMIERRIGSDIMRRALRDLVAEGRSVIVALSAAYDRCKKSQGDSSCFAADSVHSLILKAFTTPNSLEFSKPEKFAEDEAEEEASPVASKRLGTGSTASGFDDGLLGIGVGPFLKRLRAICGTDVRALVRLWAASRGIPRLQFGYRYNARRHIIEFVVKQEGMEPGSYYKGKQGLQFIGTVNVKVMEVEGASDHSVEIRDTYFLAELPCHSRRTKHKSNSQADKSVREDTMPASPVVWVRVDTDLEWCMDASFTQVESAWTSLLQSERDAVAQYKACRGLAQFGTESAAKALAGILEDDQVYWRVHAEAADALAQCKGGLDALLKFCRTRYTDQGNDGRENVKLNNFSNFRDYFVKRAIVKAIVKTRDSTDKARVLRSRMLPEAVDFTMELLKGNDNAGNAYDDDFYVSDLINAAGTIAVESVGDQDFTRGSADDTSFSARAIQEINRYRALDRLIPSKSGAVACAVLKSLSEYEAAKLGTLERRRLGNPVQDLISSQHKGNGTLLRLMYEHCGPQKQLRVRLQALKSLALVYSGDLEVCLWLLGRVDRDFTGHDIIEQGYRPTLSSIARRMESPVIRLGVMDGLNEAIRTKLWGKIEPPLVSALRRNTRRAKAICIRLRRIMVGDADDQIRMSAFRFATKVWGNGAPVCLLGRTEYAEACRLASQFAKTNPDNLRKCVVPLEHRLNGQESPVQFKAPKAPKAPKSTKHYKPPKSVPLSSFGKTSLSKPVLKSDSQPPAPLISKPAPKPTVSLRSPTPPPKLVSKPVVENKPLHKILLTSKPVPRQPTPPLPVLPPLRSKANPLKNPVDKTPVLSAPNGMSFFTDALDPEDVRYIRKAWKERQKQSVNSDAPVPGGGSRGGSHGSNDRNEGEVIDVDAENHRHARKGDGDDGHHKKKKKKKKRKLSELEQSELGMDEMSSKEKRKKKRKKKRRHDHEMNGLDDDIAMVDGVRVGSSSHHQLTPEPKIGKFKIKLNRPSVS